MKIFDKISINQPRKSVFDLSHERKFSMNMGDLVPVLCQEVLPGDKFRINMEATCSLYAPCCSYDAQSKRLHSFLLRT